MHSLTSPPPWWRRALATLWRAAFVTFRIFFIMMMVVVPIPIPKLLYRPHRERKNQVVQMMEKE